MNNTQRAEFAKYFTQKCTDLLKIKGDEYSVDGDVNGNFKRIAAEQNLDVLKVWNTYFQKHLDSIRNYIKNPDMSLSEPIEGRIMDAINYLIILASLIKEKNQL